VGECTLGLVLQLQIVLGPRHCRYRDHAGTLYYVWQTDRLIPDVGQRMMWGLKVESCRAETLSSVWLIDRLFLDVEEREMRLDYI